MKVGRNLYYSYTEYTCGFSSTRFGARAAPGERTRCRFFVKPDSTKLLCAFAAVPSRIDARRQNNVPSISVVAAVAAVVTLILYWRIQ